MFGITEFSAIINPPQCGILACGGKIDRLGIDMKPRSDMRATLSFDGRAISQDDAAAFLEVLKTLIDDPKNILLGAVANEAKSQKNL